MTINTNPKILTPIQHEVLTGHLLGDGCLGIRKQCINPRFTLRRKLGDIEYIKWTFGKFNNLCSANAVCTGQTYDERYDKIYKWCNLETRYIPAFLPYYNKWYPEGEKIVPRDLVLTPLIIAAWVGDDGAVSTSYSKNKRLRIVLHTQGFPEDDVLFLRELLNNRYNTNFTVQKPERGSLIIAGANEQSCLLLKDIDSVFPESMSRKSNVWRNNDSFLGKLPPTKPRSLGFKQIQIILIKKMLNEKYFSIYSLSKDLNYFYIDKNYYNKIPNSPIKRKIFKYFKANIIDSNDDKILYESKLWVKNKNKLLNELKLLINSK